VSRRSIVRVAAIVGALLGATVPYFAGGGSVSFFTDIEARIGYGMLSVLVHACLARARDGPSPRSCSF
jgi:hypothetical protein